MTIAIQYAVDAASAGALDALIALGIALIFGIMQLINFAHGELIMVSGYAMLGFVVLGVPLPVVASATLLVAVAVGLAMERFAFRPLRNASAATLLVSSFAVSYLLQNLASLTVGARAKSIALPAVVSATITVGGVEVSALSLVVVIATAALLMVLTVFLRLTPVGVQMRAASEDFQMARLLGVRANRVIALAFAISGLLAGVVALLFVSQTGSLTPTMGADLVLIGFVATVVGGLGSLAAAAVGGFLLGAVTVVLQTLLPLNARQFREAIVFGLVIVILLIRPQGLFVARSLRERV